MICLQTIPSLDIFSLYNNAPIQDLHISIFKHKYHILLGLNVSSFFFTSLTEVLTQTYVVNPEISSHFDTEISKNASE